MKLPRGISGEQLRRFLSRYGYELVRQTGSHMRLVSRMRDAPHAITVPAHRTLDPGTLAAILRDVAEYTGIPRQELYRELMEV